MKNTFISLIGLLVSIQISVNKVEAACPSNFFLDLGVIGNRDPVYARDVSNICQQSICNNETIESMEDQMNNWAQRTWFIPGNPFEVPSRNKANRQKQEEFANTAIQACSQVMSQYSN